MFRQNIFFYIMFVSGLISTGTALLFLRDVIDRKLSLLAAVIQVVMFLWFLLIFTIWVASAMRGNPSDITVVMVGLVMGFLHCPVVVLFLAKTVFGALDGIIEPTSGIVVRKSYDEAEGAEADHKYEKALAL